jgi:NAD(P)-dependent dehydrogenase (short-subunit alcohol dehydrogenase family)
MLKGRVAIVTGASSGIGRGCALRFAEEGATVVVCSRRIDKLRELVAQVGSKGGKAFAVACDVAKEEDIERVVSTAAERFGRIDILANIAQGGIDEDHNVGVADTKPQLLLDFIKTGPLQYLLFMQKCFPYMKEQQYGRIINTGSHATVLGAQGDLAYVMAKGAVMALTRSASQEWGQFGIVTNTIMPIILTEAWEYHEPSRKSKEFLPGMIPVRRLGTPYEDLSPIVTFLASEGAGYLNGQVIMIDGGWRLIA